MQTTQLIEATILPGTYKVEMSEAVKEYYYKYVNFHIIPLRVEAEITWRELPIEFQWSPDIGMSTSNGQKIGGNIISERSNKQNFFGCISNMVKKSTMLLEEPQFELPTLRDKTEHQLAVFSQRKGCLASWRDSCSLEQASSKMYLCHMVLTSSPRWDSRRAK